MAQRKTAAKSGTKTVAKANDISGLVDFTADANAGLENTDKDSFAIPFLRALQKISPQTDEDAAEHVPGAKGGMLWNSVTNRLYSGKEGVVIVPCAFQRRFIRWAPRGESGGFRGEYMPEDVAQLRASGELAEQDGQLFIGDDRLVDTRNHYVLVLDPEDGPTQAVMPLSSTQIKKSKQLLSMLATVRVTNNEGQKVTPPTWVNEVRVTTVAESNDQGSWYGVKFSGEGFIKSAEVYEAGKAFHEMVTAGEVKVNYESADKDKDGAF